MLSLVVRPRLVKLNKVTNLKGEDASAMRDGIFELLGIMKTPAPDFAHVNNVIASYAQRPG
jgi:hypothetical protein